MLKSIRSILPRSLNHIRPLSSLTNLSVVLEERGKLEVKLVADPPPPPPGQVQIDMRSVGVCGSDVHYWTDGRIGDFIVKKPLVLGHEGSGVVSAIGDGVTNLKIGDRVAIEPGVPCGVCDDCRTGRYNLCKDVRFHATPPIDGSLARRINHSAAFCYRLPDHVSFDQAAMLEPLSVGMHAALRSNIQLGSSVFIAGAGPIGLMCLLAAKAAGASYVVISDVDEKRLEVAKNAGASDIYHVGADGAKFYRSFDVSIDCSGVESAVAGCIKYTRQGGAVILVGMGKEEMKLPVLDAACREIDIKGVFRYANTYQKALDLVASGQINVEFMITHRFDMTEAVDAFEAMRDGVAIKAIINCAEK